MQGHVIFDIFFSKLERAYVGPQWDIETIYVDARHNFGGVSTLIEF